MGEAQDRIAAPVAARDPRIAEGHRLERRPADGLHDCALDLVADAVRIDGLAAVHRRDHATPAQLAGLALDRRFHGDRYVSSEVFVACERESAPAPGLPPVARP